MDREEVDRGLPGPHDDAAAGVGVSPAAASPRGERVSTRRARFTVLADTEPISSPVVYRPDNEQGDDTDAGGDPDTISVVIAADTDPLTIAVEPYTERETRHQPDRVGRAYVELTGVPDTVIRWLIANGDRRLCIETWSDPPLWDAGDAVGDGYLRMLVGDFAVSTIATRARNVVGEAYPVRVEPQSPPVQRIVLGLVRVAPAHLPVDYPEAIAQTLVLDTRRPESSNHLSPLDVAPTGLMFLPHDRRPIMHIHPAFNDHGALIGFTARIEHVPQRLLAYLMGATAGVRLESWTRVPQPDPELHAKLTVFDFRPVAWEINGSSGPLAIDGTLINVAAADVDNDPDGKAVAVRLQITDEPLPALTPSPAA